MSNTPRALLAGLAGAVAVTLLNETIRRFDPKAPQLQELGEEAFAKGIRKAGGKPPRGKKLYATAMAGDLISNAIYYRMAGPNLLKGAMLGLGAGLGALKLPRPMGLDDDTTTRFERRRWMTVGYYLVGGLVAAAVAKALRDQK